MDHVLDSPVWNALISGNKDLSYGTKKVKFFSKDVSPFAGFEENSTANFQLLHTLTAADRIAGFFTPGKLTLPDEWELLRSIVAVQMVYKNEQPPSQTKVPISRLTEKDVPAMLALTKLTNPGPFELHTIDFGHYYGIFENEKLVAMAGQRLHPFSYAEISAVCTHPDYTGRGYAGLLLSHQVERIKKEGCIPFLHTRSDNERAISVYKRIGFSERKKINIYIICKK